MDRRAQDDLRPRALRAHQGARGGVRRLRGRDVRGARRGRAAAAATPPRPPRSRRRSTSSSPAPATRRSRSSRSSARPPASASRRPRRSSTRPRSPSRRASTRTRPRSSRPSSRKPAAPSRSSSGAPRPSERKKGGREAALLVFPPGTEIRERMTGPERAGGRQAGGGDGPLPGDSWGVFRTIERLGKAAEADHPPDVVTGIWSARLARPDSTSGGLHHQSAFLDT